MPDTQTSWTSLAAQINATAARIGMKGGPGSGPHPGGGKTTTSVTSVKPGEFSKTLKEFEKQYSEQLPKAGQIGVGSTKTDQAIAMIRLALADAASGPSGNPRVLIAENGGKITGALSFRTHQDSIKVEFMGSMDPRGGFRLFREMLDHANTAGLGIRWTSAPTENAMSFWKRTGLPYTKDGTLLKFSVPREQVASLATRKIKSLTGVKDWWRLIDDIPVVLIGDVSTASLKATPSFSAYVWNPYSRKFINVGPGKPVDTSKAREIVAEVRSAVNQRLNKLAKDLQSGELQNTAQFAIDFREEIKQLYITEHVIARGGIDQMEASEWGQLGAALKDQYGYINNLVRDIENANIGIRDEEGEVIVRDSGIPELGDDFLNRVDMYTESAWGARGEFEQVVRDRESELGSLERRVLGEAQHCEDCLEQSEMSWQPAGVLADIGDTACGPGCACTFEWENEELQAAAEAFGGSVEEPDEAKALKADWDESAHPRDEHGRFEGGTSPSGAELFSGGSGAEHLDYVALNSESAKQGSTNVVHVGPNDSDYKLRDKESFPAIHPDEPHTSRDAAWPEAYGKGGGYVDTSPARQPAIPTQTMRYWSGEGKDSDAGSALIRHAADIQFGIAPSISEYDQGRRTLDQEKYGDMAKSLTNAIGAAKPEQPTLWRGVGGEHAIQLKNTNLGDTVRFSLGSTSRDGNVAILYAGARTHRSDVAIMRIESGARGIANRKYFSQDQEVITGGHFLVTGKSTTRDGVTVIDLRQTRIDKWK